MSSYAIGDIQGCFAELQALLDAISFDKEQDTLWFTGDLVNRGPQSLAVLRYIKQLGDRHHTVLGNHDLHLVALAYGLGKHKADDTVHDILTADDKDELILWLRHRPLLHVDPALGFVMAHAGLAPAWTLAQAQLLAREVEAELRSDHPENMLQHMYGSKPDRWDDQLTGMDRLRCIINFFTRMRFCYQDGRLDLSYKGEITNKPEDLVPWFDITNRVNANEKIIFGHWAALNGQTSALNVYPLDTGCVWGNCLTAMRLEDGKRFSVSCERK